MKFMYACLFLAVIVSAEEAEQALAPQEVLNNAPEKLKVDEQPSQPAEPAPVELQDNKVRQQRHILLKTELPTILVPTYDVPQYYIVVDQPHYPPWYYPVLPLKEKLEKDDKLEQH